MTPFSLRGLSGTNYKNNGMTPFSLRRMTPFSLFIVRAILTQHEYTKLAYNRFLLECLD